MVKDMHDAVMDPEKNPLSALPKMVRFQYLLILSYVWSSVFTIWIGAFFALWPGIIGHTALLVAVFFTADIFRAARNRRAERQAATDHREAMRRADDGTVLYDDIWGAPAAVEGRRA